MTENDIWVVNATQDFPVTQGDGKSAVLVEKSRVTFDDREKAVSFACEMLKNSPGVWRLYFECLSVEGVQDE